MLNNARLSKRTIHFAPNAQNWGMIFFDIHLLTAALLT